MMITVENVTETGTAVHIDNKYFVNCSFTNCQLIFTGGDVGWSNTSFNSCALVWSGDAARTLVLLDSFGYQVTKKDEQPPKQSSNKLGFVQ